ncbi:class I SAM-dependent methyltransferase [uncultured Jannaschia sp.]|uniref:class I SAM-dependent DNA methyltransferase n=1 Tax=uncultured Jannaschia sp. TaxID=293347 RepID=UPI0026114F22|nr:class I SAM-dependent methyltransferase [uncultured Jannaschia sp.]
MSSLDGSGKLPRVEGEPVLSSGGSFSSSGSTQFVQGDLKENTFGEFDSIGTKVLHRAPAYSAFAAIYDKAMGEAVLPSLLDTFAESRKLFNVEVDSIADIGCGTGRVLRYLSRFKGRLVGVDLSRAMLRLAERRLKGTDVELQHGDMRALRIKPPVSTVISTFDTINYLSTKRDVLHAFRSFATCLRPEGTLLFDFIPKGANRGAISGTQCVRIGPILSKWRVRIDPEGRGSAVAIEFAHRDPKVPRLMELHRQRWHSRAFIEKALGETGFAILDIRAAEPNGGDDWLHVVARRAAVAP